LKSSDGIIAKFAIFDRKARGGLMQTDHVRRKSQQNFIISLTGPPVLLVCLVLVFLSPATVHSADYLTASGCSISNVGYLSALADEYERRTGVKIFVRGGGSVVGLEDLRSGKVDFAASCRAKSAADPEDVTFVQVAWDALVFVVHKSNPLDTISLDEVRSIYAGKTKNWNQLKGRDAPIRVFISRTKRGLSGVEASTRQLVLNGKDPVVTENTVFVASSGIVEQMVEGTPGGFAATGVMSARKRNIKILKVNGVAPTNKAIIRGRYPLKRPLFLLLPKNPKREVQKFVYFALSTEGQKFISSQNVVSVLDIP
jgi:phosphate transport system substrate-binding protein